MQLGEHKVDDLVLNRMKKLHMNDIEHCRFRKRASKTFSFSPYCHSYAMSVPIFIH